METDDDIIQISKFSSELHLLDIGSVTGGLQQLLIRKVKEDTLREEPEPSVLHENNDDNACISMLPISVQLHILLYLDPCDLCRMSGANSQWNMLCNDDILWNKMIKRDMHTWQRIGHLTYPEVYEDVQSDWSKKEIYLKCCPETNQMMRDDNFMFHQLSSLFRAIIRPRFYLRPQRVVLFGPGLGKPTSTLLLKMISSDRFRVIGPAPGEFQGVGSGLWVRVNQRETINLMVLYPGPKSSRDAEAGAHKLFTPTCGGPGSPGQVTDSREGGRWSGSVQQLAATVDAFMFLINAQQLVGGTDSSVRNYAKQQVFSMCRSVSKEVPVTILACSSGTDQSQPSSSGGPSCIDICGSLDLKHLHRPWLVHQCNANDEESVWPPLDWLLQQSLR